MFEWHQEHFLCINILLIHSEISFVINGGQNDHFPIELKMPALEIRK